VVQYVLGDHLRSTTLVLDQNGAKVDEIRYYPYGAERWPLDSTFPTDYRFTGQRHEQSLGLYAMGARWYDPALARWLSADTLVPEPGDPQSLNRFSWVLGNPLRYIDPTGHQGGPVPGTAPWNQPMDPLALQQLAESLVVAGPIGAAAAGYVATMYLFVRGAMWVMNGPLGPDYPLSEEFDPANPFGATYVLPEASTLTLETNWLLAKSGQEIAAHLAMIYGEASVGGVPGHPGMPDPRGRDLSKNVKDLRTALKNELRNMRRAWGREATPNLERWLLQEGWTETDVQNTMLYLQQIGGDVQQWAELEYIKQGLADELLELLQTMGVMP
jgi:RHS repeat-associated protein